MKIAVCYIAVTNGRATNDFASRFVATYHEFPAGEPHELFVICNGGPLPLETGMIFASTNAQFYPRQNDQGWDISGYMAAAKGPCADYDMLVCLGESVFFHREDWLKRLVQAWKKHAPGMYGPFASHLLTPHLNTTAFAVMPQLLREYPRPIVTHGDRYEFEHGRNPFWKWVHSRGRPTMLVTWDGEWLPGQWRFPANILWRGDQSNCLMHCNHSERFIDAPPAWKQIWQRGADRPFR